MDTDGHGSEGGPGAVELIGDDPRERVRIELLERVPAGSPVAGDLRLAVGIRVREFSGPAGGVWVGADNWQTFLADLTRFEQTRAGTAAVRSLPAGRFHLHFGTIDAAGHIKAQGVVRRQYARQSAASIHFNIPLDPSTLRQTLDGFVAFIPPL